ncbi:SUMF1/EgtB/PvdO family nonheme iron enzyme [Humisphaera borealis]|uniref:SUMF1/EgtB/PvdO family nonheme iron enzyme n=1 Tax=Humisphaera borealis TaxID=2807512 RepID=A0A7M2WW21_9BACT|nr:SUMF1/EgtB/PvdO family nonheme iron enzyme [Humisphaera borealis]QOV88690.1 SUMF1/EgtB/PvdO family nonheme iron enzyme [Humisphaera borealis]
MGFRIVLALALQVICASAYGAVENALLESGRRATGYVLVGNEKSFSTGSSFCVDATGIFITNHHVVADFNAKTDQIRIVVAPGTKAQKIFAATIVKTDAASDVAILRVDRSGNLEVLDLASPASLAGLKETTPVAAFGFPLGQKLSLKADSTYPATSITVGRVSALRKQGGQLVDIQFDANVTFGNSGGPLIDSSGSVIGIVRGGVPGKPINFAVPVSYIRSLLSAAGITPTPRMMTDPDVAAWYIRWLSREKSVDKAAVPSPEVQKKNLEIVRGLMDKSYADKTPAGRYNLLIELLGRATETKDDPDGRYTLLNEAREIGISSGDVMASLYACSRITDAYAVRPADIVLDTLERSAPKGASQQQELAWVSATAMMLAEAKSQREEYAEVRKLIPLIRSSGTASRNPAVLAQMRDRVARLEALAAEFTKVESSLDKLKTAPEDPDANATVGKYKCLVRGDFDAGLPMLAKGSDGPLKAIAAADLKNPATPEAQRELGDQWWDMAAKQPLAADGCKARAGFWYAKAQPQLTGLVKTMVDQRLAQLPSTLRLQSRTTFTNSIGARLVYVKPGTFAMGSAQTVAGRGADEFQHEVTISQGYYMGATEVTQAQWRAVMGTEPSRLKQDDFPVDAVSWHDAAEFCRRLSQKEGKTYRLPTEAEWEYAARAGTTTKWSFGDRPEDLHRFGNYSDVSSTQNHRWQDKSANDGNDRLARVGSYPSNPWGLYDMYGNVHEWCSDWYGEYPQVAVTDPAGPNTGTERVVRGGSYANAASTCSSAKRGTLSPDKRQGSYGFRIVMVEN